MNGYIDGKVEIFCGDFPPTNLNILWYKRENLGSKSYYVLMEYDINSNTWNEINTSLPYNLISVDGGDEYILITNDNEQLITK